MGREIILRLHRPSLSGVHELYENAGFVPLDVDERVVVGAVAVFLLILVVPHSEHGIVALCVPRCREVGVQTDLHLHHILHDRELDVPPQVQREHRERKDIRVRRGGTEPDCRDESSRK